MSETYNERRERERRDPYLDSSERGPGHERHEEQLERFRRDWEQEDRREMDR